MTKEQIIQMAREAGLIYDEECTSPWVEDTNLMPFLEMFAKLVAAAVRKATLEEMIYAHPTTAIKQAVEYEREACARYFDEMPSREMFGGTVADEIRARGEA